MPYTHDDLGRGHRHGRGKRGRNGRGKGGRGPQQFNSRQQEVETAKGIPTKRGVSTSLHQPGRTNKLSASIVESMATLKPSVRRKRMTQFPHLGSKQTTL